MFAVALLFAIRAGVAGAQPLGVLHIKAALTDGGAVTAIPRHALLISDNPATSAPRLVRTGADGNVDVRLPPGHYTVESEIPLTINGRNYQWTLNVDLVAGRETVLELNESNADLVSVGDAGSFAVDSSLALARWHDSVVAVWTPVTRATGFLVDGRGVVATNQRGIDTAGPIAVQLTPSLKVAARLLAADAQKDIALLRINPQVVASIPPLSLGCGRAASPPVENGQGVSAIEAPLRQDKGSISGTVRAAGVAAITTSLSPSFGGSGGPVFAASGDVLGLMSTLGDERRDPTAHVVPTADLCEVLSIAEGAMSEGLPPGPASLPVERRAAPSGGPGAASAVTGGPYTLASADFDVALITPPMLRVDRSAGRRPLPVRGAQASAPPAALVDPLSDFNNWSEYVLDVPPVLLVRVTPKFVEGFWTRVARAAAYTQGVALPPIKRLKPGFLRLRAFCGDQEITPIHPFRIEQRVSESEAIYEGLYAFEPGAFAPSCGSVKLLLYSEKSPDKSETVIVDSKLVDQIWRDLSTSRTSP